MLLLSAEAGGDLTASDPVNYTSIAILTVNAAWDLSLSQVQQVPC